MKERGFKDVNQLEGGIINYGLDNNTQHWTGNLFVFDDRKVLRNMFNNVFIIRTPAAKKLKILKSVKHKLRVLFRSENFL